MSKLVKSSLPAPELKLIQDNSELHCYHCGSNSYWKNGSSRGRKKYQCKVCKRTFLEGTNIQTKYSQGLPLGEDVWHADELELRVNKHKYQPKLIFKYIKQDWLKAAAKKFVRYSAATRQLSTLHGYIESFNAFSEFVSIKYSQLTWKTLNRDVIIDYIDYLNSKQLNWSTKKHRLSHLKQFLEIGKINSWFEVSSYLVRPEDFPKAQKRVPRYIPEKVMAQLNQHLDLLAEPVMRMVLVIQETGLRSSELLQLPYDCLKQDTNGDWYIQSIAN